MSQLLIWQDGKTGWLRSALVERTKKRRPPNSPRYGVAAEHPMFSHEQTALIRYAFYNKPVACALCGKLRKRHWTTLVPFRAIDVDAPENFMMIDPARAPLLPALAPVCESHPLAEEPLPMEEMTR